MSAEVEQEAGTVIRDRYVTNVIDWRGKEAMTEIAGIYTRQQMVQMEKEYEFGPPKGTDYYTSKQLQERGFVGLYRRKRKS